MARRVKKIIVRGTREGKSFARILAFDLKGSHFQRQDAQVREAFIAADAALDTLKEGMVANLLSDGVCEERARAIKLSWQTRQLAYNDDHGPMLSCGDPALADHAANALLQYMWDIGLMGSDSAYNRKSHEMQPRDWQNFTYAQEMQPAPERRLITLNSHYIGD